MGTKNSSSKKLLMNDNVDTRYSTMSTGEAKAQKATSGCPHQKLKTAKRWTSGSLERTHIKSNTLKTHTTHYMGTTALQNKTKFKPHPRKLINNKHKCKAPRQDTTIIKARASTRPSRSSYPPHFITTGTMMLTPSCRILHPLYVLTTLTPLHSGEGCKLVL